MISMTSCCMRQRPRVPLKIRYRADLGTVATCEGAQLQQEYGGQRHLCRGPILFRVRHPSGAMSWVRLRLPTTGDHQRPRVLREVEQFSSQLPVVLYRPTPPTPATRHVRGAEPRDPGHRGADLIGVGECWTPHADSWRAPPSTRGSTCTLIQQVLRNGPCPSRSRIGIDDRRARADRWPTIPIRAAGRMQPLGLESGPASAIYRNGPAPASTGGTGRAILFVNERGGQAALSTHRAGCVIC